MRDFLAFAIVLLASASGLAADPERPSSRPNIVYILADDLGYGDVQCLNPLRCKIATPHLDHLARQGMTFTDAHSGASVCTPTRYGLLTGRYGWRTRLQKGVLAGGNDDPLIAADQLTLPSMLKQQGYTTACLGKWHLGYLADPAPRGGGSGTGNAGPPVGARITGGPTTRGFDYFWGCSNARTMSSLVENDRVIESLPPVEMLPRLTQRAVDYIESRTPDAQGGRPFFLYVALTSPHLPIVPSPEWVGKSRVGAYGDFVMQTDDAIGRILSALDRHGLSADTLVIVTSDNGCAIQAGVGQLEEQGHFASAHYRGYKTDAWEGGHRVPFFVRWPGRVKPADTSDALICLGDFMATMAEFLEVRLPESAAPDSISFLPSLLGTGDPPRRTEIVHHSIRGVFAIRQGSSKLILGGGSGGLSKPSHDEAVSQGLPDAQLYHLDVDPGETTNLIDTNRAEANRLNALLKHDVEQGRSTPGAALPNDVKIKLPVPTSCRPMDDRPTGHEAAETGND